MRSLRVAVTVCLAGCATGQRASSPVRELPTSAQARVATGAVSYNAEGGPLSESEVEQARSLDEVFRAGLPPELKGARHDAALDQVARAVADTYVDTSQMPVSSITQWLVWRFGAVGRIETVQGWNAGGRADRQFDQALTAFAATVVPGAPLSFGVARTERFGSGDSAQVVVLARVAVSLEPVARRQSAGAPLKLKGRFNVPAFSPKVYLDDDDAHVRSEAITAAADGSFELTLPGPSASGRRFIEITALDEQDSAERPRWRRSLWLAPLFIDVDEPPLPEEALRKPGPNPPQLSAWPARQLELFNARRQALGLQPLVVNPVAQALAERYAQARAANPRVAPDPDLLSRLTSGGLPTRNAVQHDGELDFLEEATAVSLYGPGFRQSLLDPKVTACGAAFVASKAPMVAGSLVLAEPVGKLDLEQEAQLLSAGLNAARTAGGEAAFQADPALMAMVQKFVLEVCAKSRQWSELDQLGKQLGAQGYQGGFMVSTQGAHILTADLVRHEQLVHARATHLAVSACQSDLPGNPGAELVLAVAANKPAVPEPARAAPPAGKKKPGGK